MDVNTSFRPFPTNYSHIVSLAYASTTDYMYTYLILSVFHLFFRHVSDGCNELHTRNNVKASGLFLPPPPPPIHSDCSSPPLWSDHPCLHLDVWEKEMLQSSSSRIEAAAKTITRRRNLVQPTNDDITMKIIMKWRYNFSWNGFARQLRERLV